jgi:hypothetical protein
LLLCLYQRHCEVICDLSVNKSFLRQPVVLCISLSCSCCGCCGPPRRAG